MKVQSFIRKNFWILALVGLSLVVFAVTAKINWFRYHNFDFGKFDLGNMVQMVWYTAYKGKLMWLTDYFGTNLPRWAMSHVDPILLLFLPIFVVIPHALTLVFSQVLLIIASAFIVFKIADLELESKAAAFMFGASFLFYPAVGFLLAWTGYHGVTAAIPFFLLAFYTFEYMHKRAQFTKRKLIIFWVMLVIAMMGKEQIPLYVVMFGFFVTVFRGMKKLGLTMIGIGLLWFVVAFFIIIPHYAHFRVEGYQAFAQELSIGAGPGVTDVALPNFFLSRYDEFGESYSEVVKNMILRPRKVISVFFGGDNPDNLQKTLFPMALFPLLYPPLFLLALPDFFINYLTTQDGVGTAEIINHRISMIIPGLFIAAIYAVGHFSREIELHFKKKKYYFTLLFSGIILCANIYTTFQYNNPIYLWLTQAIEKRLNLQVFAKTVDSDIDVNSMEIGDRVSMTPLENKDRECALKVVEFIPDEASVSGPDYLGAHLAQRETYGIFPSLHTTADYVVVDIFAQKVIRILDVNTSLVNDVVGEIIKDPNYKLNMACGNLFVFQNVGPHNKNPLLPLQEDFTFDEKVDLEIFQTLTVVDYELPSQLTKGETADSRITYVKRGNESLSDYFLFMSFVNTDTGEIYQVANLPSFGLNSISSWKEDNYYTEYIELVMPSFIDSGTYKVFIGMYNQIRTRSILLGEVEVL